MAQKGSASNSGENKKGFIFKCSVGEFLSPVVLAKSLGDALNETPACYITISGGPLLYAVL